MHIGASRGRVFTGQVGAAFRRTYTVLGDTAALAARLMARATEGEIYVAADAFARGINAWVVVSGPIRLADPVRKLPAHAA